MAASIALRSTSSPALRRRCVTTPENGAPTTQRDSWLSVSRMAISAMRKSLPARSRSAAVRSSWISAMTLASRTDSSRSTSLVSVLKLMVARSASATWRSRCSSSISQSNLATASPFAMKSPASASHSRRPAMPAVICASLRLNTVPAAGTTGATSAETTRVTVTGVGVLSSSDA